MASSHHHHHHHQTHQQQTHHHTHQFNNNNNNCTSSCCSGCVPPPPPCCTSSTTTSCASLLPPPPPPPLPQANPADQLLQALATTLLLQSQPQLQLQPPLQPYAHPHSQFQTLPIPSSIPPYFYTSEHLASNHHQCQYAGFQHKTHPPPPPPPPPTHKSHEPLASLLDRVAALESSLFSNSSAKSVPAPAQKPSCCYSNHDSNPKTCSSSKRPLSLRDLAARTIQVHFRQYLVRRSQILRDLKRLAVMKCHVAALRSAVSRRGEIDPRRASDQAADLLLQLDFIRSADPMIYEGKRAIEKELVRIIEFVDKIFPREQEIFLRGTDGRKEDDGGEEEDSTEEEEEEEEEKKPKKKVSFEERSNRPSARNSKHELYRDVFDGRSGEPFQFPKEVFEIGDELEFDQMEGPFGRKVGERGSSSLAPLSAQNDPRRSDERR